jgi:hypothetical protein
MISTFSKFVDKFEDHGMTKHMKGLFYAVLKTEGDILCEIEQWDLALKCFKTLKDLCGNWGGLEYLIMRTY